MAKIKDILIKKVNKSDWWHVLPSDKFAYQKRGKFLASTYHQAEFYGHPNFNPEKVKISNPVFGFSEQEILKALFGQTAKAKMLKHSEDDNFYKKRITLDGEMFQKAKSLGYDAIVLICKSGKKSLMQNKKPNSIELNLLHG
ncbi:MAG: hypothetical protein RBG1_1C00001G0919 [candidate division Zixibacteria bacterium RBG-1]|nr:MAG: hypothetical protein RBG1_1C00001G0919 [candidate division Zixibacteria bacterium RBG-1]OGC85435.1 MAG: hypothetical protein A2V73_04980 [candidate division Zixibacteria bacterium RBG_19FT_COMBO_42_43]